MSQILVLDDEENYALMLCTLLNEYGFAVDVATSANDACQRIRDTQYALIVSDYRMPLMDGGAFLKKVRMIHPRLPVFLVSGVMDTAELVKVANLGATRVYEKPLDTEMFLGQVQSFVEPDREAPQPKEDPFYNLKHIYEGTRRPAYQTPLQFLPDLTPQSKGWIERLYAAWNRREVLCLLDPPGGEAHLGLKECTCWEGRGRQVIEPISLQQFIDTDIRPTIDEAIQAHRSIIVPIVDFEAIDDEDSFDAIAFLYESAEAVFGSRDALYFAFVGRKQYAQAPGIQHVKHIFRTTPIDVPRLAGRVGDISFLLCNQSEQSLPQGLWPHCYTPEVSSRLLGHTWPKNFSELASWLQFLGDTQPAQIDTDVLSRFFRHSGRDGFMPEPFDLEETLTLSQQHLLEDLAQVTGKPSMDILGSMGFDVDSLPEGTSIRDFEFLFPSVLEEASKED